MTSPIPRSRLLIVDDNRVNRLLLAHAVEQLGHQIETAENGRQALDKLRASSFDLVLLDIEMPEMDGYQLLDICLQDSELRNIPIIMTSSHDEIDSVIKCVALGAEDYLSKPVNPILLRARVNASLEKKRLRDDHRRLIRTFADKDVADELMRDGFSLGGKHSVITSMFCDIRDFTTITEANDPADVIELINEYYEIVIETVQAHGGNANQMQGDGLMSFFGAPVYYPDHAQRAVKSALDICRQIAAFNVSQTTKGKLQIAIGVGIATGQVIAGYAGTRTRATYICIGDTVNLSSRLESHTKAVKRQVVIDENTRRRLDDSIDVEPLGEELFKGKTIPVQVYSVRTT
ncbi:MAG: adenylate/guanylate cyclase domain-containing protein [Gemmatimonadota bacterium]|mgnify:CR=1 FL=1